MATPILPGASAAGIVTRNCFPHALAIDGPMVSWQDDGRPDPHIAPVAAEEFFGHAVLIADVYGRRLLTVPDEVARGDAGLSDLVQRIGTLANLPHAERGRVYRSGPRRRAWVIPCENWHQAMRQPAGLRIDATHVDRVLSRVQAIEWAEEEARHVEVALKRCVDRFYRSRRSPEFYLYEHIAAAAWAVVEADLAARYGWETEAFVHAERRAWERRPTDLLLMPGYELVEFARRI